MRYIEPGYDVGVSARPSHVTIAVQITAVDGVPLDELFFDSETGGSLLAPSTGHRLRADARTIGRNLAEYLAGRVHPEECDSPRARGRGDRGRSSWARERGDGETVC